MRRGHHKDVTLRTSYARSSLLQVVAVVAWRIDDETVVLSNSSSTWAQRYRSIKTSGVMKWAVGRRQGRGGGG
jgi:hypothetical protein